MKSDTGDIRELLKAADVIHVARKMYDDGWEADCIAARDAARKAANG